MLRVSIAAAALAFLAIPAFAQAEQAGPPSDPNGEIAYWKAAAERSAAEAAHGVGVQFGLMAQVKALQAQLEAAKKPAAEAPKTP